MDMGSLPLQPVPPLPQDMVQHHPAVNMGSSRAAATAVKVRVITEAVVTVAMDKARTSLTLTDKVKAVTHSPPAVVCTNYSNL